MRMRALVAATAVALIVPAVPAFTAISAYASSPTSSVVTDDPTGTPTDPTTDPVPTDPPTTSDPTTSPTTDPTTDPTGDPTTDPTGTPTDTPTDPSSPSDTTTPSPSDDPTTPTTPTTQAPGVTIDGLYNAQGQATHLFKAGAAVTVKFHAYDQTVDHLTLSWAIGDYTNYPTVRRSAFSTPVDVTLTAGAGSITFAAPSANISINDSREVDLRSSADGDLDTITDNWTSTAAGIALDNKAPAFSLSRNLSSFHPYKDGYQDTFSAKVYGDADPDRYTVQVFNSKGSFVKTLGSGTLAWSGSATDRYTASPSWNGTTYTGAHTPAGTYTVKATLTDAAGNSATKSTDRRRLVEAPGMADRDVPAQPEVSARGQVRRRMLDAEVEPARMVRRARPLLAHQVPHRGHEESRGDRRRHHGAALGDEQLPQPPGADVRRRGEGALEGCVHRRLLLQHQQQHRLPAPVQRQARLARLRHAGLGQLAGLGPHVHHVPADGLLERRPDRGRTLRHQVLEGDHPVPGPRLREPAREVVRRGAAARRRTTSAF